MKKELKNGSRAVCIGLMIAFAQSSFGVWYDNPVVEKRIDLMVNGWVDPHYMNKSADGRYIGVVLQSSDSSPQPTVIYDTLTDTAKSVYEKSSDGPGANWKGCALSSDLGLMVTGSGLGSGVAALVLNAATYGGPGTNAYPVTFSEGYGDGLDFGTGSTYLYSNNATTKNLLCRYSVGTLTEATGNTLTLDKSQASSLVNRIRSISVHRVNERELVYFGEGDEGETARVCVMDVTDETWTETDLTATVSLTSFTGNIMVVKLSNEDSDTPILYVLSDDGKLAVCQLTADGKSISSIVKTFTASELRSFCRVNSATTSKFRNFEVSANGDAAYLLHGDGLGTALVKLGTPAASSFNIFAESAAERIVLGSEVVYRFTGNGKLNVFGSGTVEVLLVGGGGGGGMWNSWNGNAGGGGGGAGGLVHKSSFAVSAGNYDVVVGAGGKGGGCSDTKVAGCAGNGGNSSVFGLVAYGGGGGANWGQTLKGADGGSGGGGANGWANTAPGGGLAIHAAEDNLGNIGGEGVHQYTPGGGGGAGTTGGDRTGGDGLEFSIVGTNVWYAGGGAGHSYTRESAGGKGGGGYRAKGEDGLGGGGATSFDGGSGVVIVRFTPTASAVGGDADISGGDETKTVGDGKVVKFTQDGTLTVSADCVLDVLLVGGGGGAGGCYSTSLKSDGRGGGGGGAGGFVYQRSLAVVAGSYEVKVGAGGVGGGTVTDSESTTIDGANGGNSSVFGFTAYGGGGGGAGGQKRQGLAGGCGGGSTSGWANEVAGGEAAYGAANNIGFPGGGTRSDVTSIYSPAGGGGAGAPGETSASGPGAGGDGLPCDISGDVIWYAGGGAGFRMNGACENTSGGLGGGGNGTKGTDGLGGGGSGGCNGGSGVVIVRLRKTVTGDVLSAKASGGVVTRLAANERVHTFTSNGTFTMPCDGVVDILLVGGGGGGGSINPNKTDGQVGGGGGAGGLVYQRGVPVKAGSYAVAVGAGGVGGARVNKTNGKNGGNSSALGFTAYGGGGAGGASGDANGSDGGSGGGASSGWANLKYGGKAIYASAWNWGHKGGDTSSVYRPAGGGGAGAEPVADSSGYQTGGNGLQVDITGESVWYAGGGGGYRSDSQKSQTTGGLGGGGNGTKGTDGLGGGGSGGCNGGSGVVIIRYAYTPKGMAVIVR